MTTLELTVTTLQQARIKVIQFTDLMDGQHITIAIRGTFLDREGNHVWLQQARPAEIDRNGFLVQIDEATKRIAPRPEDKFTLILTV